MKQRLFLVAAMGALLLSSALPSFAQIIPPGDVTNVQDKVTDPATNSAECAHESAGNDIAPAIGGGAPAQGGSLPVSCQGAGGFEQKRFESGDLNQNNDVRLNGDNNGQCVPAEQSGATGNAGNQEGFTPGVANVRELEPAPGIVNDTNPALNAYCAPSLSQLAQNQV